LFPSQDSSRNQSVSLDSQDSFEVGDLLSFDLWGLIWLSNSVPLSESGVSSESSSLSITIGKDKVSLLDISDRLGSGVNGEELSPAL